MSSEVLQNESSNAVGINDIAIAQKESDLVEEKTGRRVTFPNDERIVSGYMDPPDPWGKAHCCTTEELVCAYKAACDAYNVQPHKHLLEQLKGIDLSVCNDRYEMLSCRNLKLDGRHIEALEEIFKRVQFKTLDFENCNLEEDSAIALFDMIEYYESCCKLNIAGNNKIGPRGWQMCSRMIKKTASLHTMDLRSVTLAEQSIPVLVRSLRIGSALVTLNFEHSNISGRNLLILVTALRMNESLRELLLADNKLMPTDGQHLGSLLKNTPTLQLLDVRNNCLQDNGCSLICEGLFEQQYREKGLQALMLWQNQITQDSMPDLSTALAVNKHLQTLNIGHNNIGNEGMHHLRDGLLRNRSLLRLGLQLCRIGCEGAVALAECLAESPQMLRLDLRDNQIKTAGLMALKLALSVNRSLTRMDLDKEFKKEPLVVLTQSMRDYAEQQSLLLEAISSLLLRNRTQARERELQQLDEQQSIMEREETASQDSLQRPRSLSFNPPDAAAAAAAAVGDGGFVSDKGASSTQQADLVPDVNHFASVTSPTDRVLDNIGVTPAFCPVLMPPANTMMPVPTQPAATAEEAAAHSAGGDSAAQPVDAGASSEQQLNAELPERLVGQQQSELSAGQVELVLTQSEVQLEAQVGEQQGEQSDSVRDVPNNEQTDQDNEQDAQNNEQKVQNNEQKVQNNEQDVHNREQEVLDNEQTLHDSQHNADDNEENAQNDEQIVQDNEQIAQDNEHSAQNDSQPNVPYNQQNAQGNEQTVQNNEQEVQNNEQEVQNNEQEVQNNEQEVQNNEQTVKNNEQSVQECEQTSEDDNQNAQFGEVLEVDANDDSHEDAEDNAEDDDRDVRGQAFANLTDSLLQPGSLTKLPE